MTDQLREKIAAEITRLNEDVGNTGSWIARNSRAAARQEALRWVLAQIEALPTVGVGWKMVPVEPTEAMLANTVDERKLPRILDFTTPDERDKPFLMPRFMYRAMIAASPQSPGEEKGMGHATARHPPVIAPNRTPTIPPAPALIAGLEIAKTALEAAPHGDNCFLHSGGGYYDRCFCGKDSVVAHLDGLLHAEAAEQTDPPQIDEAREIVRRALHAADNGNHAGEQAILRMASPNQNGGLSSATDNWSATPLPHSPKADASRIIDGLQQAIDGDVTVVRGPPLGAEDLERAARALTDHAFAQRGMTLYDHEWDGLRDGCMAGMRAALLALNLPVEPGQ